MEMGDWSGGWGDWDLSEESVFFSSSYIVMLKAFSLFISIFTYIISDIHSWEYPSSQEKHLENFPLA